MVVHRGPVRQLDSLFLAAAVTPPLGEVPSAPPHQQVEQERYEQEGYDREEGSDDRVGFFAAQAIKALGMDAGTDGGCAVVVVVVVVGLAAGGDDG